VHPADAALVVIGLSANGTSPFLSLNWYRPDLSLDAAILKL
jgi:hypothetical protein